tara:strand:- start:2819 stop:3748 length:930 start_codon:yes stop_codon:yes gene_type:complete
LNNKKKTYCDWVAVDWGTSNMRYWVMHSNEVIHSSRTPFGMVNLDRACYENILVDELDTFLNPSICTPILICGMAGARQGWKEAPYKSVPCKPPELHEAVSVKCKDSRFIVKILPGLKQNRPADIMRGEETQIKGILEKHDRFDGVVCLPGTHTKWVRISAGEVVSFQTFMTGELFSLLSEKSVLKHSIAKEGLDEKIFKSSIEEIISNNKIFAAKVFGLRAESIIKSLSVSDARSRLSGYLIGLELSGSRAYWLGETVFILGEDSISLAYEIGLRSQGVEVIRDLLDMEASLEGLKAIFNLKNGMNIS